MQTGNFAWAGLDMAMLDLAGQDASLPLWRLLGGRGSLAPVSYFYYLARDTSEGLARQCVEALAAGYEHFYLKVGLEPSEDERMISDVPRRDGPGQETEDRRQRGVVRAAGSQVDPPLGRGL